MLPERLQQMEANADQMIKALSEPAPAEEASPSSVAEEQAAAEHSVEAGQTDIGVAPENSQPSAPDMSDELKALKQEVFNANQRWNSLQGMLDKKDQELDSMRNLLAQFSQRTTQEPDAPKVETLDAEKEQFGEEIVNAMLKAADVRVQNALDRFVAEKLTPLIEQIQGVQQVATATAGTSFEDRLAGRVPNWKQLNVDPGFMEWLNQPVPYSVPRVSKLQALQKAYQAMDLDTTAAFFTDYLALNAPPVEAAPAQPKPTAEKFAAPGRPKAAPAANDTTQRIWTAASISELYKNQRHMPASEFEVLERDLFKAQEEGRIAA